MSQEDRLIGRTLGRYRIDALIGRGGLATVYRATDLMWDAPVAVKVLPEFFASDEEHRQRFQREASTMANLIHPNLMPVRDYDQVEGLTFFVMDYADGGTLEDKMGAPMPLASAVGLIEPVAAAVAYAHGQGVVHRDLKPTNILFDREGRPLITDFGIAKLMEESGLTRTRESLGTPEYMAPEQAREASLVDKPADVYALGVILFQLVTGQVPYQGNTVIDVIEKHKYAAIPSARGANPGLPPAIDDFFRRVLAKEPASRVQTVDEMMGLLRLLAEGRPLPPDTRAPVPAPAPPVERQFVSPTPSGVPRPIPRSVPIWTWLIIVGVVVVAAIAIILVVLNSGKGSEKLYTEGLSCYRAENWSCGVEKFGRVIAIDPNYRDAATRLADSRRQLDLDNTWREITRCGGSEAKSKEDLRCVYENAQTIVNQLDPADSKAQALFAGSAYKLADLLSNDLQEDPQEAMRLLASVKDAKIASLPEGFNSLYSRLDSYLKGQAAFARGDWKVAVENLTPVMDFRDSKDMLYVAHARLCQEALKAKDLTAAAAEAQDALNLNPNGQEAKTCAAGIQGNRYDAIMTQARTHLAGQKWQDAIDVCNQALALRPSDAEATNCITKANTELYQAACSQGKEALDKCRLPEAIMAFDEALKYKPGDSAALAGKRDAQEKQTPKQVEIADSFKGWGGQGERNWYYLARGVSGVPQQIGWSDNFYSWNPGEGSRITQVGQHPGAGVEVIRRWRSTVTGQVIVTITYSLETSLGSTYFYLEQDGQRGNRVYVSSTREQSVQIPWTVAAGHNLDLVLNANGTQTNDYTYLHMMVQQQVAQCTRQ
jgi:serine/threonine-protein kinase